jgi:DNA polymerase III subunit epsilon
MNLYAIVDIETTGGSADRSGITEIAIRVWDGKVVVQSYTQLINPEIPIPLSIQTLTGIDDALVKNAPTFREIAEQIHGILNDKIFVAHNVHFDYSFVNHAFRKSGIEFRAQKLCTVRLARKILPGIKSYSLGNLTEYLSIPHMHKHRAGGDADATVLLFKKIQEQDFQDFISKSLKQESCLAKFPPKVKPEDIQSF